jgi:dipeptide/tripeptide permease
VGVVLGSLLIGFTVERPSYATGFATAGVLAVAGVFAFLLAERSRAATA